MWWLAHGEDDVPDGVEWLSAGERARLGSLRFAKRHTEFRTRRWTAKQTLARMLGLDTDPAALATIEIGHESGGAPFVCIERQRREDLEVSLSDRAGWAVCLARQATGGREPAGLGIDLEIVEPRSEAFVDDFFTSGEREWVRRLAPGDTRHAAANLIWSAKEAALKVLKRGLRADTRTVEVHVDQRARADGWAVLEVQAAGRGLLPGWWRRDGVFVLTLAAAHPFEPPRQLPGGSALADAGPRESWRARPLVGG